MGDLSPIFGWLDYRCLANSNRVMQANLRAFVERTFKNCSLDLVYFEMVANSIDADATNISIEIKHGESKTDSLKIKITDDGRGMDDEGYARFCTLFEGRDIGHKGLGRIALLPNFDSITYTSYFGKNCRKMKFSYDFNASDFKITEQKTLPLKVGTTVELEGYLKKKVWAENYVTPSWIKEKLINHFVVKLFELAKVKPDFRITITANDGVFYPPEIVSCKDIEALVEASVDVDGASQAKVFHYLKAGATNSGRKAELTAVVDGRCAKFPADVGIGEVFLPAGSSLNIFVEWAGFGVDEVRGVALVKSELSRGPLRAALRKYLRGLMRGLFPDIDAKNLKTVNDICADHPSLIGYVSEDEIGLMNQAQALRSARDGYLAKEDELKRRVGSGEARPEEVVFFQERALAEYIQYRQRVIECLEGLKPGSSEEEAHNLIIKMKKVFEAHAKSKALPNLWLIDERFMSYTKAFSDIQLAKISHMLGGVVEPGDDSAKDRPDILLSFANSSSTSGEVEMVIVELKKRFGEPKENATALFQVLTRAAQVMKAFPRVSRTWYYGLVEMDSDTNLFLRMNKFMPLFSTGKTLYRFDKVPLDETDKVYPVMMTFLDYQTVVDDAKARNKTFLDILKDGFHRPELIEGLDKQ